MKVLVTGGAGFIGSHTIAKLQQEQCQVVVIDNLRSGRRENVPAHVKFIEMDICSEKIRDIFASERFNAVIHLAAQTMVPISLDKPDYDCLVNIFGTVNLLETCRRQGVKRVVFASSAAVYGDISNIPVLENAGTVPASFYGLSKLTAEKYFRLYQEKYGLEYVVFRYANVYGERQGDSGEGGVISIFARRIRKKEPLTIFGNGGQTRDFVYAGDVAEANWLGLTTPRANEIYNVGTAHETSVNALAEILAQVTGGPVEKEYLPMREGDIYRSVLDNTKLRDMLGWRPAVALPEGLLRTYRWLRA